MGIYILRRLLLLPITLFFIVLVNFVILNLAPGEPTTQTELTPEGSAAKQTSQSQAYGGDDRYLQFREFYGLTLPILFNNWPSTSQQTVDLWLWQIVNEKQSPQDPSELPFKELQQRRVEMGDRARFVMDRLLHVMQDEKEAMNIRRAAVRFFVRGGTQQSFRGPTLTADQKAFNRQVGANNNFLAEQLIFSSDTKTQFDGKVASLAKWYEDNKQRLNFEPSGLDRVKLFFFETRFSRYLSRVLTLDFGTMRNDSNKTVISEVTKRFKYSLTLSLLPMIVTLALCLLLGFTMALCHNRWPDLTLNVICLILYAIPVFVVAPFLIEKVALYHYFPFTNIPIPLGGFTSPEEIYENLTSAERVLDVLQHIALPLLAILYGSLAAQSRLARTAVLEVLRQDYVRTAYAKGVPPGTVLVKHVGRNAAVTIVTSIAGSLGVILGGSLIVEILFQIDGYGKFFYDAIINRDYNVVMFSALAGSFLALMGYLAADLAYAALDPRVKLD